MSQLLKSRALILSAIRWKETSKIITMFTREWGTLKIISRGALRKNNPVAGKVDTLNLVDIIISSKTTRSLQILTDIDLIDSFNPIRKDLERLSYSLSILELIHQTIAEHHADDIFFDFTVFMLDTMKSSPYPENVFIYFLLKLTSFLGFKPNFSECATCEKQIGLETTYFSIEKGTSYCKECAEGISIFQRLNSDQIAFLSALQRFPHRRIQEFEYRQASHFNYIQFLIDYLSFHQGQNILVRSLNLIKK